MDRSLDFWGHGAQFISVFFMKANISEPAVFFYQYWFAFKGGPKSSNFPEFCSELFSIGARIYIHKISDSKRAKKSERK